MAIFYDSPRQDHVLIANDHSGSDFDNPISNVSQAEWLQYEPDYQIARFPDPFPDNPALAGTAAEDVFYLTSGSNHSSLQDGLWLRGNGTLVFVQPPPWAPGDEYIRKALLGYYHPPEQAEFLRRQRIHAERQMNALSFLEGKQGGIATFPPEKGADLVRGLMGDDYAANPGVAATLTELMCMQLALRDYHHPHIQPVTPAAPVLVNVSPRNGGAWVEWDILENGDGGADLTSLHIEYQLDILDVEGEWERLSTRYTGDGQTLVEGMENGRQYRVRMLVQSRVGTSPPSRYRLVIPDRNANPF